jgi:tartrate dehydratase beta subunit/fumarate hydratase class I family protein
MNHDPRNTAEGWSIHLTSDRVVYVRGTIYTLRDADALIDALRTIKPLLPSSADSKIDGDWAE